MIPVDASCRALEALCISQVLSQEFLREIWEQAGNWHWQLDWNDIFILSLPRSLLLDLG